MGALVDAEQAERLRRGKWTGDKGANRLAQEIYAIWTSKAPYQGDPINIIQQGDTPVINITIDGGNPITQGPPITGPIPANDPPAPIGGGGGLPGTPEDTTIVPPSPSLPTGFPIVGWGIVTGKVSGNVYTCQIYLGNPSNSPLLGSMQVTQRQIDSQEEIPVGTETMLLLTTSTVSSQIVITGGTMQVPVFLERDDS